MTFSSIRSKIVHELKFNTKTAMLKFSFSVTVTILFALIVRLFMFLTHGENGFYSRLCLSQIGAKRRII